MRLASGVSLLYWGGLVSSASGSSVDLAVMSLAGSSLLFGIGTQALP